MIRAIDPSPFEIEARRDAIKRQWDARTEMLRRTAATVVLVHWSLPIVAEAALELNEGDYDNYL